MDTETARTWMTPARTYRITGGALVASAVVSLAGGMAHPVVDGRSHSVEALTAPASPWAQLAIFAGALLLMVGLPGAFAWLSPRLGKVGLIGLALYFVGNAVSAQAHLVVEGFVAPTIARDPRARHLIPADGSIVAAPPFVVLQVVAGLVLVLGLLLLGVGLLRQRTVPRWIGAVLVVGAVLAVTPLPEVAVLTGLQIELCRGLSVASIGVLMIRSARTGHPVARSAVAAAVPA